MLKLSRFLKGFRKQMILGPLFKMTEAAFELIVPLVMASMIDVGIYRGDVAYVWKMGGVLLLLGVVGLGCSLTCQFFASRASQGFGTVVREELFRHINTLSHAELDQIGTPSLITRLNNDVNQLQLAVAMLIRLVFRAPFIAIGGIVMAMLLDWQLSIIFLLATALIALALYWVMSHSIPFYGKIQRLLDRISLITREGLDGARVIRAFSNQAAEQERFEQTSEELRRSAVTAGKLSALLHPATAVITNAAIMAVVWFGGLRVNSGTFTQGQVIALWNYLSQISLALIVVANLVVIFTKAAASAARVNEVFELLPGVTEHHHTPPPRVENAPCLELRDVSFSYAGTEECALEHITLTVAKGETIGIIGGTGAGKSTLVSLIPRFYDASSGSILVEGVPVEAYPFAQLRRKIGMVPQRAVLFSGTVRSNLLWGAETATEETLWQALRTAQAAEFVEKLPLGLDAPILQNGKNLSGGQRQRLTIARALVGKPSILILDDSASALDFATDAALRHALLQDTQSTTVLMVSQRANTVRDADRIVVLEDGALAGIGTHRALYRDCAVYREICLSQQSTEEAEQL